IRKILWQTMRSLYRMAGASSIGITARVATGAMQAAAWARVCAIQSGSTAIVTTRFTVPLHKGAPEACRPGARKFLRSKFGSWSHTSGPWVPRRNPIRLSNPRMKWSPIRRTIPFSEFARRLPYPRSRSIDDGPRFQIFDLCIEPVLFRLQRSADDARRPWSCRRSHLAPLVGHEHFVSRGHVHHVDTAWRRILQAQRHSL